MPEKNYTFLFDSSNHWRVITQMTGSLWPAVLPYCLFNMFTLLLLTYLKGILPLPLDITKQGHAFIGGVVSFLLISRLNAALARFNHARTQLGVMYREARELINNVAVYTSIDKSEEAKEWRNEVAYNTLVLLRTAMAVIDYQDTGIPAWDIPEVAGEMRKFILEHSYMNEKMQEMFSHDRHSELDEIIRVPVRVSYLLLKSIHTNKERLETPLTTGAEMKVMGSVSSFMGGYYGMETFITTPVPFPLVQMARTFLFLYVFTTPFVFLSFDDSVIAHCVFTFILTFGFVGLEFVSIELDNPFGSDENDFDNLGLAHVTMEDAYLTIMDVDGKEWSDKLRNKMHDGAAQGSIV